MIKLSGGKVNDGVVNLRKCLLKNKCVMSTGTWHFFVSFFMLCDVFLARICFQFFKPCPYERIYFQNS